MKYKGAVSVRRIRGPKPAATTPASFILAISFSDTPPSGPKTARIESPGLRALNCCAKALVSPCLADSSQATIRSVAG